MKRPCLVCGEPSTDTRCAFHERQHDRKRGSRQQRGYDRTHDAARRTLGAMLPAPCGYCDVLIGQGERWVAAHVVDGQPEYGWQHAHPVCNERAKPSPHREGGPGSTRNVGEPLVPAMTWREMRTGSDSPWGVG